LATFFSAALLFSDHATAIIATTIFVSAAINLTIIPMAIFGVMPTMVIFFWF
jgi:cation transport ATPase